MILLACLVVYPMAVWVLPFPNWKSFGIAFKAVVVAKDVRFQHRIGMLLYILRDVALSPVWASFWLLDEFLYGAYRNSKIGTTFLLRTLSEDSDTFLSVKHLEWRYPYISFWKLLELLKLRDWLENRSYWPNTELGRRCNKIHHHVLGNYEEFGIFLEERYYHHYFVFRRFPFAPVLERVSGFNGLPERAQNEMINTLIRVVKKVYFYRGSNEIFLAKENENVEFCQALVKKLTDARILMICRDPQPMLDSYLTMSITCTEVKHGVDPTALTGWHDMNMQFRHEQCRKFIDFWYSVQDRESAVLVTFREFTTRVLDTTIKIYGELDLPLRPTFLSYLTQLQSEQRDRKKGYENFESKERGFEFYKNFVQHAEAEQITENKLEKVELL